MDDKLTKRTVAALDGISPEAFSDEASRYAVKEAARRLLTRMQTPFEHAWGLTTQYPYLFAAVQVGVDLGVFEGWSKAGGGEASLEDLLAYCNKECDANVLGRLFRLLASFDLIEETGEQRWRPTHFSLALGDPEGPIAQLILSGPFFMLDASRNLPQFLAKTSYREPVDPQNSNFKDKLGLDFFAYCGSDPRYQKSFINGTMIGIATHKVTWTEVFDTQTLLEGYDGGTFLVDIGGGHGIDSMHALAKHPTLPDGALVLQDLPDVVAMAKIDPKIKTSAHSFFEPEPIKGSRAYYYHAVLHDWNDTDCRRILQSLVPAMKKGYSKLLLYEIVLPATGVAPFPASLDIGMMVLLSSAQRTEAAWRTLLEGVGLKVVKIWKHDTAIESLIEAELA